MAKYDSGEQTISPAILRRYLMVLANEKASDGYLKYAN